MRFILFASLTSRLVSGDQVIFLPALPSAAVGVPCKERRLEPLREAIRKECANDVVQHCRRPELGSRFSSDVETGSLIRSLMSPPVLDEDDFMTMFIRSDPFLQSVFLPMEEEAKQPLSRPPNDLFISFDDGQDQFESLLNDMMEFSLRIFDSSVAAEPFNEPGETKEASEDVSDTHRPEQASEKALDVMVASLVQRASASSSSSDLDESAETEEASSADHQSEKLAEHGSNLLSDIKSQRRRLSEGGSDPRVTMKERLARRLTEYRTDLFYYPDGTVAIYTTSYPSVDFFSPKLGLGSVDEDECILAKLDQGLLSTSCADAVRGFLSASSKTESETPTEMNQEVMTYLSSYTKNDLVVMLSIFFLFSSIALCTGFMDVFSVLLSAIIVLFAIVFGLKSLFFTMPIAGLLDYLIPAKEEQDDESSHDDENESLDGLDYVNMSDESQNIPKLAETQVFVGVPVQVV